MECQALMSTYQTEMSLLRKQRDEKLDERLSRTELNSDKALDELFCLKDQHKLLQDERKKDIEETAEFIKQVLAQGKQDWQRELARLAHDLERAKRELPEKASAAETLEMHARVIAALEAKVDIREVQQALNEC